MSERMGAWRWDAESQTMKRERDGDAAATADNVVKSSGRSETWIWDAERQGVRLLDPAGAMTPGQAERLYILMEECGEVVQAIGKVLRHGYADVNPEAPGSPDNRDRLGEEITHVEELVRMMVDAGDLDERAMEGHRLRKAVRLAKWTRHQEKKVCDGGLCKGRIKE